MSEVAVREKRWVGWDEYKKNEGKQKVNTFFSYLYCSPKVCSLK